MCESIEFVKFASCPRFIWIWKSLLPHLNRCTLYSTFGTRSSSRSLQINPPPLFFFYLSLLLLLMNSESDSDVSFDYPLPICPPVLSTNIQHPLPVHHHYSRRRRADIPHPYARLFAKKDEVKRRKIWNHALEKFFFTPYELSVPFHLHFTPVALSLSLYSSTLGAPQRRTVYIASLEAHIDKLHSRLIEWAITITSLIFNSNHHSSIGFFPVKFSELDPFKGLNSKTAKVLFFFPYPH